MKGSDRWGRDAGGPRKEVVLAALVVVSLAGIYLIYVAAGGLTSSSQPGKAMTISTTGVQCGSGSMPELAQRVEQDAGFAALSGGQCYKYNGEAQAGGVAGTRTLYFDRYNGTIDYPCGTFPRALVASQIVAVVNSSTGQVLSVQMSDKSALATAPSCPAAVPVGVVSVTDVESTIPAVPQLNVTLVALSGPRPVSGLSASLALDGGVQTFRFGVAPSATLAPGQATSSVEIVLATASFNSDEVYPMTISGTFDDGQTFSYSVLVQVAGVP